MSGFINIFKLITETNQELKKPFFMNENNPLPACHALCEQPNIFK